MVSVAVTRIGSLGAAAASEPPQEASIHSSKNGDMFIKIPEGTREVYVDSLPVKATLSTMQEQLEALQEMVQMLNTSFTQGSGLRDGDGVEMHPPSASCAGPSPTWDYCYYETASMALQNELAELGSHNLTARVSAYADGASSPVTQAAPFATAESVVVAVRNFTVVISGNQLYVLLPTTPPAFDDPRQVGDADDSVKHAEYLQTQSGKEYLLVLFKDAVRGYAITEVSDPSIADGATRLDFDTRFTFGGLYTFASPWLAATQDMVVVQTGSATVSIIETDLEMHSPPRADRTATVPSPIGGAVVFDSAHVFVAAANTVRQLQVSQFGAVGELVQNRLVFEANVVALTSVGPTRMVASLQNNMHHVIDLSLNTPLVRGRDEERRGGGG